MNWLKAMRLLGAAKRLGILDVVYDTIASMVNGDHAEAMRRAERGAKASAARKAIEEMK